MPFTAEEFRKIVDKNHLTHRIDDDGNFVIGFAANENDPLSIMVVYSIRDVQLHIRAYCQNFMDAGDVQKGMTICNQWNIERFIPKTYLDANRTFVAEWSLLMDDDTTMEYVDTYAIHVIPAMMSSFFGYVDDKMNPSKIAE